MAQWLKMFASRGPRFNSWNPRGCSQLNSGSRKSNAFFLSPWALHIWCIDTHAGKTTPQLKNKNKKNKGNKTAYRGQVAHALLDSNREAELLRTQACLNGRDEHQLPSRRLEMDVLVCYSGKSGLTQILFLPSMVSQSI